jgi:hypothetical protein
MLCYVIYNNRKFAPEYVESTTANGLQILNSLSAVVLINWASNLKEPTLEIYFYKLSKFDAFFRPF